MLAALIVMLRLGGFEGDYLPSSLMQRWLLAVGTAVFVATGLASSILGLAYLQYPDGLAGIMILLIESAATLSIAIALGLAFTGGHTSDWQPHEKRKTD